MVHAKNYDTVASFFPDAVYIHIVPAFPRRRYQILRPTEKVRENSKSINRPMASYTMQALGQLSDLVIIVVSPQLTQLYYNAGINIMTRYPGG